LWVSGFTLPGCLDSASSGLSISGFSIFRIQHLDSASWVSGFSTWCLDSASLDSANWMSGFSIWIRHLGCLDSVSWVSGFLDSVSLDSASSGFSICCLDSASSGFSISVRFQFSERDDGRRHERGVNATSALHHGRSISFTMAMTSPGAVRSKASQRNDRAGRHVVRRRRERGCSLLDDARCKCDPEVRPRSLGRVIWAKTNALAAPSTAAASSSVSTAADA
jgi:hypothetical protein